MPLYHSILTGIAMGDGRTHTAYKRANTSKEVGDKAIEGLCETGVIRLEKSKKVFTSWKEEDGEKISNKLFFTSPFLRFWFAFISPLFKGVRDGDYKEVKERFKNRESEFIQLTFAELSHEVLKMNAKEDPIKEIGTYWDNEVELEIYGKTTSGKVIAGISKYTNSKMKKSSLTKLQEDCKKARIEADILVLVSKNGFTNELKSLKSKEIQLLSLKNFKKLVLASS